MPQDRHRNYLKPEFVPDSDDLTSPAAAVGWWDGIQAEHLLSLVEMVLTSCSSNFLLCFLHLEEVFVENRLITIWKNISHLQQRMSANFSSSRKTCGIIWKFIENIQHLPKMKMLSMSSWKIHFYCLSLRRILCFMYHSHIMPSNVSRELQDFGSQWSQNWENKIN